MGYLVDKAKPRPNFRDVGWPREVPDSIKVLSERLDISLSDFETRKLHCALAELKLFGVEDDSILSHKYQVIDDPPPMIFYCCVPHANIVHTLGFSFNICNQIIVTLIIPISRSYITLRSDTISESPPFCDECGAVSYTHLTLPTILRV